MLIHAHKLVLWAYVSYETNPRFSRDEQQAKKIWHYWVQTRLLFTNSACTEMSLFVQARQRDTFALITNQKHVDLFRLSRSTWNRGLFAHLKPDYRDFCPLWAWNLVGIRIRKGLGCVREIIAHPVNRSRIVRCGCKVEVLGKLQTVELVSTYI